MPDWLVTPKPNWSNCGSTMIARRGIGSWYGPAPRSAIASTPPGLQMAMSASPFTTASTALGASLAKKHSRHASSPCGRKWIVTWRSGHSSAATSSEATSSMSRERMTTGMRMTRGNVSIQTLLSAVGEHTIAAERRPGQKHGANSVAGATPTAALAPAGLVGAELLARVLHPLVVHDLVHADRAVHEAGLHAPLDLVLDRRAVDVAVGIEAAPLAVVVVAQVGQVHVLLQDVHDQRPVHVVQLRVVVVAQRVDVGHHEAARRLRLVAHELLAVVDDAASRPGAMSSMYGGIATPSPSRSAVHRAGWKVNTASMLLLESAASWSGVFSGLKSTSLNSTPPVCSSFSD